jgi:F0F1-type ATP synthase assembly protein I
MPDPDDMNWGKLAARGMEIAVGVALGAVVGNWLDRRYDWDPWGTLLGTALGFIAGIYPLVKAALTVGNKKDEK